ncbi:Aste57867_14034 [Aphanomyces stellatus]|uniref:Aste57867_14034 protein n=1 Tax=Aphanomyces stellatus TaxID=120398 RepID=A0A485L1B2_9STRA|nr:hypothetical protein As57867_013983 [Aphanomyces stellatus]VFT90864.1 Aste57867_14034 [Aphanomyces stellatus]
MQEARECTSAAILLSIAFLLMFTSYGGIESLETSIIPGSCKGCLEGTPNGICQSGSVCQEKAKFSCDDACAAPFEECQSTLGNTILGVVYLAFCLSSFVGPVVPNYLGMKKSLFCSSIFYVLFACANLVVALTPNEATLHAVVMLSAATLLGLAASALWIAQASYITQLSVLYSSLKNEPLVSSMGTFNGIFYGIFNLSGITGNLISSLVLESLGWSTTSLFIIYTVLGASGTAMFLLLPPLGIKTTTIALGESRDPSSVNETTHGPKRFSIWVLWELAKDTRMIVWIPVFAFTGLLRGFAMGEFTANFTRESLGTTSIGYVMALYGAVTVVGAYGFGKLADKFGPLLGQVIGYVVLLVAYCMCYWIHVAKCDGQWTLVVFIAILLSLGDASLTTLTNVVVGQEFSSDAVNAFSIYKVYQSGTVAASFFFFKYLSFHGRLVVVMLSAALACGAFVLYSAKYRRVSTEEYLTLETPSAATVAPE